MISITNEQALAFRMKRHLLSTRLGPTGYVKAAGAVCGVQAQFTGAGERSLWARVKGARVSKVRSALWDKRSLVRGWAMRGTVHLMPAEDLPLYMAFLRREPAVPGWLKRMGFTLEDLDAITESIAEALSGNRLSRREIADAVSDRIGRKSADLIRSSWGSAFGQASRQGLLCFGPPRSQETTFVRADEWIGGWLEPALEDARAEVARRYLRAYGPATAQDFAYWAGKGVTETLRIFASIESETVEVEFEGKPATLLGEDVRKIRARTSELPVRLLSHFDTYLLGHRSKDSYLPEVHRKKVFRPAAWIAPVMLIDGKVAGVWEHSTKGRRLVAEMQPFERIGRSAKSSADAEVESLASFSGLDDYEVHWPKTR